MLHARRDCSIRNRRPRAGRAGAASVIGGTLAGAIARTRLTAALVVALSVAPAALSREGPTGLDDVPPPHRESLRTFIAEVRQCLASDSARSCLPRYVKDRVYFPEMSRFAPVSPVCRRVHEAARERDGHGWYATDEEFAACILDTGFPYPDMPDRSHRLKDDLAACFRRDFHVLSASRDEDAAYAALEGIVFTCRLTRRDRWLVRTLVAKP